MAKYKLMTFSEESFAAAMASWRALTDEDVFELECAPIFAWAKDHLTRQQEGAFFLDLHNTDRDKTDALVEVISGKKGRLSKMLKVFLPPPLWPTESRKDVIEIYTAVFFCMIEEKLFTENGVVKLYGRNDEMVSILRSIHAMWSIKGTTAEFEGRFLTITINDRSPT